MENQPTELWPADRTASYLGLTIHALARWREQSTPEKPLGPVWVKVEGTVRYPLDELLKWLEARKRNQRPSLQGERALPTLHV